MGGDACHFGHDFFNIHRIDFLAVGGARKPDKCAGLVNDINRLVWQATTGDIATRHFDGRLDRVVGAAAPDQRGAEIVLRIPMVAARFPAQEVYDWAAKEIGNGAEAYAHNNIKKHEQLPLKLSMLNPIYFLMYCTGEKMNITQIEGQFPQAPYPKREHRELFVKDWHQVPDDRFKQYFLDWEPRGEKSIPYYPTPEMCCDIVDWQERMHYIDDALGMCAGLSSFPLKPPYHIHNYPKFISAGAGYDMDEEKLKKAAKRYRTLVRAINIRRGMRRKDDAPPKDHWKKRFPELEKELLDTYYKFKGWNNEGIPTKESLHELGLDYVSEDFIQRGILTNGEDASSKEMPTDK